MLNTDAIPAALRGCGGKRQTEGDVHKANIRANPRASLVNLHRIAGIARRSIGVVLSPCPRALHRETIEEMRRVRAMLTRIP